MEMLYIGILLVIMAVLFYKIISARNKDLGKSKKSEELLNEINIILDTGISETNTPQINTQTPPVVNNEVEYDRVKHTKKTFLCSASEKKLLLSLQDALDSNYMIHCQTSLIAITEPTEPKYKERTYSKRVDFVITDKGSRILAVIELVDTPHLQQKVIERDRTVDTSLKGIHPFIRIQAKNSYNTQQVAELLEVKANIPNKFEFVAYQDGMPT